MQLLKQLTRAAARAYCAIVSREARGDLPLQSGALPSRATANGGVEILLVTGKRSGQWTIPKGWPMPGKSLAEAAAKEAFEEAGVCGATDPEPVGSFRYTKQKGLLSGLEIRVVVHRLSVERELLHWPESRKRKRKWFKAAEAAKRIKSRKLSEIILREDPSRARLRR